MLAQGENIQTNILGMLRDSDDGVDPLLFGGDGAGGGITGDIRDGENTKLHTPESMPPGTKEL